MTEKVLHILPFASVAERLAALGIPGDVAPAFWEAVRANLTGFEEARSWWTICTDGPTGPVPEEERGFVAEALALLPPRPWTRETWGIWTKAVQAVTGRKGRALFHPLRIALTGRERGPEMAALLPLLRAI